ncbi:Gfo/Idh/MocA family protein [Geminisphaera colitermitum]|uniref:Gfo/Idh/MocA family protein n=1 Tax=Geminisphaera colitermitum TaxID=1148786 RepID=UPI000158D5B2|nr:Gfo/Idh/MocA family oxidoreductase [Geminisphaera colitermitum]
MPPPKLKEVRLGIIGVGNIGNSHTHKLLSGKVPGCRLTAHCDINPARLPDIQGIKHYTGHRALLQSAVLIATPHYSHTTIGIDALNAGLHVLVEKPISVHKADCQRLIAAHKNKRQVFSAMFNQRTDPYYQKVRELVRGGELGTIRRINWIITGWFRSHAYYASGGWRATWAGEGGGVLLNQCPHNLDLYQWIFGMPAQVRGFCQLGRYHDIEVEDDVTAYFQYPDGATGVFITSTGEAPGTNRLEVTGEQGKLVLENNRLIYTRNEVPMSQFSATTSESFGKPAVLDVQIPSPANHGEQHIGILKNFTNAILHGEELIAPAAEGIHSVELGNAILQSSLEDKTIKIPLSAPKFEVRLKKLIATSRPSHSTRRSSSPPPPPPATDFSKSF